MSHDPPIQVIIHINGQQGDAIFITILRLISSEAPRTAFNVNFADFTVQVYVAT